MKHLSYYCSDYLTPQELQTLNYVTALHRKILAAKQTIEDLQDVHFLLRDNYRIYRIGKAIDDWQNQISQVYERITDD